MWSVFELRKKKGKKKKKFSKGKFRYISKRYSSKNTKGVLSNFPAKLSSERK